MNEIQIIQLIQPTSQRTNQQTKASQGNQPASQPGSQAAKQPSSQPVRQPRLPVVSISAYRAEKPGDRFPVVESAVKRCVCVYSRICLHLYLEWVVAIEFYLLTFLATPIIR
uniref:Uncharacterized protein n=1 Tax=Glossina brevipalpis TaxID=37001 RepID=A0A1A9WJP6_9MUSC